MYKLFYSVPKRRSNKSLALDDVTPFNINNLYKNIKDKVNDFSSNYREIISSIYSDDNIEKANQSIEKLLNRVALI